MTDTAHQGPAPSEDRAVLTNLGLNGPRDVTGQTRAHLVPNQHVVLTR